jgi:hypothetical protein
MDPKYSDLCPYKVRGLETETHMERVSHEDGGRDGSDETANEGVARDF